MSNEKVEISVYSEKLSGRYLDFNMNIDNTAEARSKILEDLYYTGIIQVGKLAEEYAGRRLPLQVLKSAAGFYIGTFDVDDGPISRESIEYFATYELATQALILNTWTQKEHP